MNLDTGIINHWAYLFESEEAKTNGTYLLNEDMGLGYGEWLENTQHAIDNNREEGDTRDFPVYVFGQNTDKYVIFPSVRKAGLYSRIAANGGPSEFDLNEIKVVDSREARNSDDVPEDELMYDDEQQIKRLIDEYGALIIVMLDKEGFKKISESFRQMRDMKTIGMALNEGTNPDGTIDDFSFQRDGEEIFAYEILALMFRGLGYRDIIDSNGMIEPQLAIRCGMEKIATMKCQIEAVDVSFDKVLNGQKIQEILQDKLKLNLEMNGENSEYYISRGFDQEFKDAFKKVIHDKIVLSRAGIGPKELPSKFKFEFIDKEEQYDGQLEPTDIVWTIRIEFDEISNEDARRRELDLFEFGNFKNKKEIDKILSKQFRKNLKTPNLPQESKVNESENGKEIINAFTGILNSGLPNQELENMLASLETLKGKDDVINQTELQRLITMYKRKIGGV